MTTEMTTEIKKTWNQIQSVKDLEICPQCGNSYDITILSEQFGKIYAKCGCGCRFFETKNKMWLSFDYYFDNRETNVGSYITKK